MGGMFKSNGTTSVSKSVPRLVLDKARQVLVSVDQLQYPCSTSSPKKSFTRVKQYFICSCCSLDEQMLLCVSFFIPTVGILVDTWTYSTLYPGGITSLTTGISPPSCILLENRLYILLSATYRNTMMDIAAIGTL